MSRYEAALRKEAFQALCHEFNQHSPDTYLTKMFELLDVKVNEPFRSDASAWRVLAKYYDSNKNPERAMLCATKSEEIAARINPEDYDRIANVLFLARLYFDDYQYDRASTLIDRVNDVITDDADDLILKSNLLKLDLYHQQKRYADYLAVMKSVYHIEDLAKKVNYILKAIEAGLQLQDFLPTFATLIDLCRLLQISDEEYLSYLSRIKILYDVLSGLVPKNELTLGYYREMKAISQYRMAKLNYKNGAYLDGLARVMQIGNVRVSDKDNFAAMVLVLEVKFLLELKRFDEAKLIIDKLTDIDDLSVDMAYVYSRLCIDTGRYQEAIDELRMVLTSSIDVARIPCKLLEINLLYGMKYFVRARELCKRLLEYCEADDEMAKEYKVVLHALQIKILLTISDPASYDYPVSDMPRVCAACWKVSTPEVKYGACGRCHGVYYCNVTCQTSKWPEHKPNCNPSQQQ